MTVYGLITPKKDLAEVTPLPLTQPRTPPKVALNTVKIPTLVNHTGEGLDFWKQQHQKVQQRGKSWNSIGFLNNAKGDALEGIMTDYELAGEAVDTAKKLLDLLKEREKLWQEAVDDRDEIIRGLKEYAETQEQQVEELKRQLSESEENEIQLHDLHERLETIQIQEDCVTELVEVLEPLGINDDESTSDDENELAQDFRKLDFDTEKLDNYGREPQFQFGDAL
jgi:vacuolar-type H+-ATPase subunit I/STV1